MHHLHRQTHSQRTFVLTDISTVQSLTYTLSIHTNSIARASVIVTHIICEEQDEWGHQKQVCILHPYMEHDKPILDSINNHEC